MMSVQPFAERKSLTLFPAALTTFRLLPYNYARFPDNRSGATVQIGP